MRRCPKCKSKVDIVYKHPDFSEIMRKILGYKCHGERVGSVEIVDDTHFPYFYETKFIDKTEEAIEALEKELEDESKKVKFFFCSNPKCFFYVKDDGLDDRLDRTGRN